jgi:hypothetical protein
MPTWAWVLIFVAVVGGAGLLTDLRARRMRRGLEKPAVTGSTPPMDAEARMERTLPGTTAHSEHIGRDYTGS